MEKTSAAKFLESKGQNFDGCDTVRLYDYLIYYEQRMIKLSIATDNWIPWFSYHMSFGGYVFNRLTEEQKRTWTEFKQNLLEAYKKEEEVRMSWSVPRYPPQKRNSDLKSKETSDSSVDLMRLTDSDVRDTTRQPISEQIKSDESGQSAHISELSTTAASKVICSDRKSKTGSDRSGHRLRCHNCGSATHIKRDCRVSIYSDRRNNNHREIFNAGHQPQNVSFKQHEPELSVSSKGQLPSCERERLIKPNEDCLETDFEKRHPMCSLLKSGSNCRVISPQFYSTFFKLNHLLREMEESLCSTVDGFSQNGFEPSAVSTRFSPQRPSVARSPRQLPLDWRVRPRCNQCY